MKILVDKNGEIIKIINSGNFPTVLLNGGNQEIDCLNNPLPQVSVLPFWSFEEKCWKDKAAEEEISSAKISFAENKKINFIKHIKSEAEKEILKIAQMYEQVNWYHDGIIELPEVQEKIQKIKKIRKKSNDIEEEFKKLTDPDDIINFQFSFEEEE